VGADTAIEWATHTFNPWTGCTRVSPGCDHCYAAEQAKRNPAVFGSWEPGGARKRTSADYWKQPLRWNREAERTGVRPRVFCASMADVFDNQVPEEWRWSLWRLIASTPHLDWLLLTKRPQNIALMLPEPTLASMEDAEEGPWHAPWPWPNVWLGTTVENQAEADRRIPHLLAVPAARRFLSCEPLLGPVDLSAWWKENPPGSTYWHPNGIHWVIAGGESGPGARPMHPDWARSLRDQCAAAGVPFFFKQWGEFSLDYDRDRDDPDWRRCDVAKRQPGRWINLTGGHGFHGDRVHYARRVGKKAAGRLLDGIEHNEVPHA
jgi:protein gp37